MSTIKVFTCSHVRPVVFLPEEDGWFHIGPNGNPAGACVAGIYRDEFELPDNFHALVNGVQVVRLTEGRSGE